MANQTAHHLLQAIGELYQHANLQDFRKIAQRSVRKIVPQEMASYNEVDFLTGRNDADCDHPQIDPKEMARVFQPYMNEHPVIRYINKTGDGSAHRITDFITQKQFEKTKLYRVVFEPNGLSSQMSIAIQTPELVVIGLACNRSGRDFNERDRRVLNLFRPHLVQAYQNARAVDRLRHERDELHQIASSRRYGVVITTAAGKIDSVMGIANHLLATFFEPPSSPGRLPGVLQDWLTDALKASAELKPRSPMLVKRNENQLTARLLRATQGRYHTLVLEPVLPDLPAAPLKAVGLTDREIEVLKRISDGKSNLEIAEILRSKPRTVQKHLEHIYEKLQVQTRGAAAAKARSLVMT